MKKVLVIMFSLTLLLTGCGKEKKKEEVKEEKKEEVIETSPNVNFDSIDNKYKTTFDEYLSYVPLRKLNLYDKDAYSGDSFNINKTTIGLLSISSANIYNKDSKEIKACGEELEGCAICFSDNCILMSEIVEKLELNFNKFVTPDEIFNSLSSKTYYDDNYKNNVLKISKVLSFDSNETDLFIYEKAGFAYLNGEYVDVYKTSNKDEKILSIKSNKLNSKEVIDEVINNIDKFNTYKHTFKTREQKSDFYYYYYGTEVE